MNRLFKQMLLLMVSVAFSGGVAVAQTQAPQPVTNVLLVHGAFADSSSWKKVIGVLPSATSVYCLTLCFSSCMFLESCISTRLI
jgi:hypothetical protein